MDTICDEASNDPDDKKRAKEIEVIEIEWENAIYSENDRVVRKYFQVSRGPGHLPNLIIDL